MLATLVMSLAAIEGEMGFKYRGPGRSQDASFSPTTRPRRRPMPPKRFLF